MAMTAVRMGADQRRELVVRAAIEEFAKGGYNGTSTEAIAKRAGISQPYVFRLFDTKKDLFIAVISSCFERVHSAFEAAANDLAGWEALEAMGREYSVLLQDRQLLLTQMHAYAASDDPDIRDTTRAGYRKLYQLVERVTGLPADEVVKFFAIGMLINVAAAMDLQHLNEDSARYIVMHTCPDLLDL